MELAEMFGRPMPITTWIGDELIIDTTAMDEYADAEARLRDEQLTDEWWALITGTDNRR